MSLLAFEKHAMKTLCYKNSAKLLLVGKPNLDDHYNLDNAGDFRLVDRKVLNRLNDITDSNPYTRGLISSLATNETGVPYARPRRVFGHSKFPILKLFPLAIDGLVSNSLVPLRCAVWFGLFYSCLLDFCFFILFTIIFLEKTHGREVTHLSLCC